MSRPLPALTPAASHPHVSSPFTLRAAPAMAAGYLELVPGAAGEPLVREGAPGVQLRAARGTALWRAGGGMPCAW